MNSIYLSVIVAILSFSSIAQADSIGLKGDINYWSYNGSSENQLFENYDLDRDHGFQASIAFEHPVPFLPNLKIKHTSLENTTQKYAGIRPNKIDLSQNDFILYYELLDNVVSADIGFGLKNLSTDIRQYNRIEYMDLNLSGNLLLGYAAIEAKLPFSGLSTKGEVIVASDGDSSTRDIQAEIKYNFIDNLLVDIGTKIGYRYMNINVVQNKNDLLDLEFRGPYIGLDMHF